MAKREELGGRARRAYELGRLRAAARAVWVIAPMAIVSAAVTRAVDVCGCLGVGLIALATFLRWRDRRGSHSVRAGLVAGTLPLLVGLGLSRLAACGPTATPTLCAAASLGAAVVAGAWSTRLAGGATVSTVAVASVTASLGCAALGPAAWIAVPSGLLVGLVVGRGLARRR